MSSELRAYHPSARERTEQFLRDLFAGGTRPSAVQASQVRGIMNVLDYSPAGILFGAHDAGRMTGAGIANASPLRIAGGGAGRDGGGPVRAKGAPGPDHTCIAERLDL